VPATATRISWLLQLLAVTAIAFHVPLAALIKLSLNDEGYSYVLLIPFVTLGLVLVSRKAIFLNPRYCPAVGGPLIAFGTVLSYEGTPHQNLSMTVCGIVLIWIAGFVFIFGLHAIIVAGFPFGFLLLMIPIPAPALKHFVSFMQYSSAYVSGLLFKALMVPALRQGVTISLPGIDIGVAEQCSGIRSSIALVLASSLAGFVLLRGSVNRLFLVVITVPIVVFKNAVRIVALSILALYVDKGFLSGRLHLYGGLCFSLLDIAIVVPLLLQLRKSEAHDRPKSLGPSRHQSIYGATREP